MNKPSSELIALADDLSFAAENTQGCLYSQRKMLHAAAEALRTTAKRAIRERIEAEDRATPPAQPAPASSEKSVTCERCQGNGEIVTDWNSYLHPANLAAEQASVAECPDCDGEGTVGPSEATHGKPDGAMREAQSSAEYHQRRGAAWDIVDEAINSFNEWMLDDDYDGTSALKKIVGRLVERRSYYHGDITANKPPQALLSPKIAAAEISPGDVLAMKEACKRIVVSFRHQVLPADRAMLRKIEAAIDRLDVKAEAKSQEPDAVAIKPLEWVHVPSGRATSERYDAITLAGVYSVYLRDNGDVQWAINHSAPVNFVDGLSCAKAAAQEDYEHRIRAALIHPTTKPEAPAVSVDAIKARFDAWFENNFFDPDGGSDHLPDWLKDDLRSAWNAALNGGL